MRIDRFTTKLQSALADAQSIAAGRDHNYIAPVHLVSVLLKQQGGSTRPLLSQMGTDINRFEEALGQLITNLPVVKDNFGDIQMSPELGRLFNLADKYAQQRSDQFISSELVILAATEDRGELGQLFKRHHIQKETLERVIAQSRVGSKVDDDNSEE